MKIIHEISIKMGEGFWEFPHEGIFSNAIRHGIKDVFLRRFPWWDIMGCSGKAKAAWFLIMEWMWINCY